MQLPMDFIIALVRLRACFAMIDWDGNTMLPCHSIAVNLGRESSPNPPLLHAECISTSFAQAG